MRRELFIHFAFWFSFFIFISIFRDYLSVNYWQFWVGGAIGTILPNVDHLVYVFFLNPHELTSQRVDFLLKKKEVFRVLTLLSETRTERKNLVFHTFVFQLIFFAVAFLVLSSSTSMIAKGLVLAFIVHLLTDQIIDFTETKNLDNWGNLFPENSSKKMPILYISVSALILLAIALLL